MVKTSRKDLAQTIATHTLQGGENKNYARQVANLLLSERRTGELDSILRDVQADWTEKGFVEVIVTSAHPLASDIKEEIRREIKALYPTAKKVIVTEAHDPDVIGGVRVSLPNRQLDFSVEAKLNKLKGLLI